jgi:2-isopropylmalate synthase
MDPSVTGNRRSIVVSELSGRAAVAELLEKDGYEITKDSPETQKIMDALRDAEARGCQYDHSEASLRLLTGYALGLYEKPFKILDYKLIFSADALPECRWSAIVKVDADGEEQLRIGEGDGPVNALDIAAHLALKHKFPYIEKVKMVDIKTRIDSNDSAASASIVRAYVEYGDGEDVWRTMGASTDIVAASWQALIDAYEYYILLKSGQLSR